MPRSPADKCCAPCCARAEGIELAGWQLGAAMFAQLEEAAPHPDSAQAAIDQASVGGSGLWLRAEPDEDARQADALAAIVATGLTAA